MLLVSISVAIIFAKEGQCFYLDFKENKNEEISINPHLFNTQDSIFTFVIYNHNLSGLETSYPKTMLHPHSDRLVPLDEIKLDMVNLQKKFDSYDTELSIQNLIYSNLEIKRLYDEYIAVKERAKKEIEKIIVPFYDQMPTYSNFGKTDIKSIYSMNRIIQRKKSRIDMENVQVNYFNKMNEYSDQDVISFFSAQDITDTIMSANQTNRKINIQQPVSSNSKREDSLNESKNRPLVLPDTKSLKSAKRGAGKPSKVYILFLNSINHLLNNKSKLLIYVTCIYIIVAFFKNWRGKSA
jgi:hypothetical protein